MAMTSTLQLPVPWPSNATSGSPYEDYTDRSGWHCNQSFEHDPHAVVDDTFQCVRRCGGRRDESPYPPIVRDDGEGRVIVYRQDEYPAPNGFNTIRRFDISSAAGLSEAGSVHIGIELYTEPPREYPPMHVGSKSVGIILDDSDAAAVRDAIDILMRKQS